MQRSHTGNGDARRGAQCFDFGAWRAAYADAYGRPADVDDAWLAWFVGFCEGECSFTVASRGDRSFVVPQGYRNLRVLLELRDRLGFGRVVWHHRRTRSVRWVVQDRVGLALIVALFDGNIVLAKRRNDLLRWADGHYVGRTPRCGERVPVPTTDDGWLCGFSDGEACFHARLKATGYRFEYSLSQGGSGARTVLKHIGFILGGGRVRHHSEPGAHSLIVADLRTCARVASYFDRWPLRTTKATSYERWNRLRRALVRGDHLYPQRRPELRALALSINAVPTDAGVDTDALERMDGARRARPHPTALRPAVRSCVRTPRRTSSESALRPASRRR